MADSWTHKCCNIAGPVIATLSDEVIYQPAEHLYNLLFLYISIFTNHFKLHIKKHLFNIKIKTIAYLAYPINNFGSS